jgi:hypothetical protein
MTVVGGRASCSRLGCPVNSGLVRTWQLVFAACVVLLVAGCSGVDARGEALKSELRTAFPDKVTAVDFEHTFLDPPLLLVDVRSGMTPEAERQFLCAEIAPMVSGAGGGIDVTTTYGWYMSEECPRTGIAALPIPSWLIAAGVSLLVILLVAFRPRYRRLTPVLVGVVAVTLFVIVFGVTGGAD